MRPRGPESGAGAGPVPEPMPGLWCKQLGQQLGLLGRRRQSGPGTDVHPRASSPRNQRARGPRPGINTPAPPPQHLGREGLGMWEPDYHRHCGNRPALARGLGERSGTDPLTRLFLRPLHRLHSVTGLRGMKLGI